jgi:hypothetical protein
VIATILLIVSILLGYKITVNTTASYALEVVDEPTPTPIVVEVENEYVFHPYYELSDDERHVVESMVMGEAEGESYTGKLLVAQCILNASLKEGLPPSQIRVEYKYSGWNENPDDDVKNAVSEIFDYGYKVVDEEILYFYAPKRVDSTWHESLKHVITEGGHKFFALWEE